MGKAYSKLRVLAVLVLLFVAVVIDHVNSTTFARNSGVGGVETTLSQRDDSACAPCGAPCPSTRE